MPESKERGLIKEETIRFSMRLNWMCLITLTGPERMIESL